MARSLHFHERLVRALRARDAHYAGWLMWLLCMDARQALLNRYFGEDGGGREGTERIEPEPPDRSAFTPPRADRASAAPAVNDEWLDKYAAQWGEKNKVDVKVDHVRNADLPARLAAESSAGAGHDLFEFQAVLQAATYKDKLVELNDVADAVGKKYGGWTEMAKTFGSVDGQQKALMTYAILQPHIYRKDYFKEVGYDKFPDDWREFAFVAGWQGPFHSGIEEINSTFVMPNMFARAIRGDGAEAAMKWAEGEYNRIFKAHNIG